MEVIINGSKFELENKIYGLLTLDELENKPNVLLNIEYYDDINLSDISLNMAKRLGYVGNNSFTDKKIKHLAKVLSSKDSYYILENFEKNFTYQDNYRFINFFRMMTSKYHKCIILKSNDMNYLSEYVEGYILLDDEEVISKNNLENINLYNTIEKPEIVKFVELCKLKGINIKFYNNHYDLLKGIYKLVK